MLGGACLEQVGEQCARSVDRGVATVRSCIRGHHRFHDVAFGDDRLLVASRSVGDDPVLGSMGGAFHFSGDRDFRTV